MSKTHRQAQKKDFKEEDQYLLAPFLHFDKIDKPLFSDECASLLKIPPENATLLQAKGTLHKSTSFRLPVTRRSAASNLYDVFALETKRLLEKEYGKTDIPLAAIFHELDNVAELDASLREEADSGLISMKEAYEILVESISEDLGIMEKSSTRLPRSIAKLILDTYLELSSEAQKIVNGDEFEESLKNLASRAS